MTASGKRLSAHLARTIGAGLLLLVPVVITYLVLRLLFTSIDDVLQPALEEAFGRRFPGLGAAILVVLVYLAGLVASRVVGRRLIRLGQGLLLRVPVIGSVYSAAKQLIESFSGEAATGFKRVVVIEYPREGLWTIGFLTGTTTDERGQAMGLVYIPTAPTPQSGWVAILPMGQIYDTDLTVGAAMRLVLSGGISAPPRIRKRPAAA